MWLLKIKHVSYKQGGPRPPPLFKIPADFCRSKLVVKNYPIPEAETSFTFFERTAVLVATFMKK